MGSGLRGPRCYRYLSGKEGRVSQGGQFWDESLSGDRENPESEKGVLLGREKQGRILFRGGPE